MSPREAYGLVSRAIKNGVLVRPNKCQKCGNEDRRGSDGRSCIQAHHEDYDRPLDVEWVCAKCHRQITPLPSIIGGIAPGDKNGMRTKPESRSFGQKNGFSKLTEEIVTDMRLGEMSPLKYAEKHNVSRAAVYDVLQGRRWSWFSSPLECDVSASKIVDAFIARIDGCQNKAEVPTVTTTLALVSEIKRLRDIISIAAAPDVLGAGE